MFTTTPITNRDRSVLRAIAAGRATLSGGCGTALLIDGLSVSDQFVAPRLAEAGLIADFGPGPNRLTPRGEAVLQLAS